MIEKACIYFDAFSDKDLDKLSEVYSEDVVLTDWDIHFEGKNDVLEANKNLFDSLDSINIKVTNIGQNEHNVFAEIDILINDDLLLHVVDVLSFNSDSKIKSIRAYKR